MAHEPAPGASPPGPPPASTRNGAPRRAAESTVVHTRILRCMLAVEDCAAYWQRVDRGVPAADRARVAFEQRWFGVKSEARVRTLMADMFARFDAFPAALDLLTELSSLGRVTSRLRPFLCHVHTQLADPIYRAFTGDYLPMRRAQGYRTVELDAVARWVDERHPERWAPATRTKFASNLLATALDVGLVGAGRDPRPLTAPAPPPAAIGYVLHLLREVDHEGAPQGNPYLRSLGVTPDTFADSVTRVPGLRFAQLGRATELTFLEPSLLAWGRAHLSAGGGAS